MGVCGAEARAGRGFEGYEDRNLIGADLIKEPWNCAGCDAIDNNVIRDGGPLFRWFAFVSRHPPAIDSGSLLSHHDAWNRARRITSKLDTKRIKW